MSRFGWLLIVLGSGCSAQAPLLSPLHGDEVRYSYYPNGRVKEAFVVRKCLIVDTLLTARVEPPYDMVILIDSAVREFRVADYMELYPDGKTKVKGQYRYAYGGHFKSGEWVHFESDGDTLFIERFSEDAPPDTLYRLDLRLHR